MNTGKRVIIRNRATGEIVASSTRPLRFESNLYFDEQDVNMDLLTVTDRIYTCSYKGTCFWIDLRDEEGRQGKPIERDVAWVYRDPFPGYEMIRNKIGFWPRGSRRLRVEVEKSPKPEGVE
ncbi:MAG: DUF427 domain-containing protein [Fidelibacterota bacterium]